MILPWHVPCSTPSKICDHTYLQVGATKVSFGEETDRLLAKLVQRKGIKSFQTVFQLSFIKLNESPEKNHPTYDFYQAVRVFDPRQLPCISHDIDEYGSSVKILQNPSIELMEEWLIYTQFREDSLPILLEMPSFWVSMTGRFPVISNIALDAIWLPVTSVDVESFPNISIYCLIGGRAYILVA